MHNRASMPTPLSAQIKCRCRGMSGWQRSCSMPYLDVDEVEPAERDTKVWRFCNENAEEAVFPAPYLCSGFHDEHGLVESCRIRAITCVCALGSFPGSGAAATCSEVRGH